ncbi:MAG: 23S rRNA (uracil(1939)-C(5))-methyltransferase RlmD [Thiomonas sp.]|uniref:23S rRNA (uracil(1939)-C(5))-methyltransferase RlmD n=1 Tax=Thiomonas sp. TaxID=2047785 RepID=UPI002A361033|nr:23S rRNA (uracil(1939)-C(5))-methyltransferase RlmD [Thiomonas sp.]MDY0331229.1 23S rRNA (uracil(1939)-C(5))-methyltransferase RlmD [Thiomonas sp.]
MEQRLEWLQIDSLDLQARGVGRSENGKVVFVDYALPTERVQTRITRSKRNWESGEAVAWANTASSRVTPRCPHFGVCGGCSMQHVDPAAQLAFKQRILEDDFWHLSRLRPQTLLRPIAGPNWGYRARARLTVRLVPKKGGVLVGFHEKGSSYVADMRSCDILPKAVSDLLLPLRELIAGLSRPERAPQIELAMGDRVTALVLRHLEPLTDADRQRLRDFGRKHGVQWWLQPKGPDSVVPLDDDVEPLSYVLPEFGVVMPFRPTDFTQVNPQINRVMVARALRLLGARRTDRVIDWFCGLGNFTLPIATQARQVLGVEGSATLVARALDNALYNGLQDRVSFTARNLFEMNADDLRAYGEADLWLVDPPRDGALALCKALAEAVNGPLHADEKQAVENSQAMPEHATLPEPFRPPRRIVYVSCNPATLARDAGLLVHQAGYTLRAAGVMNMFPHTAHVESMAVFERD